MTALTTLAAVSVAVAAISIALFMLDDFFSELERRRRADFFMRELGRARQRHS
jgi:recombinational DNA repair ATPase RecF